jgi:hypothetical protein
MKRPVRSLIILAGTAVLLAGHGIILYYISSQVALSMAVIVGVLAVVLVKHLGLLAPLYALPRRPSAGQNDSRRQKRD